MAGYYLRREFGCGLVLDYRDEWTECPFDFVMPGTSDRSWEERCLRAADRVVFTTRSQLEHQLEVFKGLSYGKCAVIPNGWGADDSLAEGPPSAPVGKAGSARYDLSFIGTSGSWTMPGAFLEVLDQVLRRRPDLGQTLRLRFIGRKCEGAIDQLKHFSYQETLDVIEEVPQPAALQMMRSSAALLLLNEPRLSRYLPGKLYEYIAARRPVLVFGEGGEVAGLIRRLGAGVVVPKNNPAALEHAIDRIVSGNLKAPSGASIATWLSNHTRERMARRFFDLVQARFG
jgi:glycosyltransferase involved in cell wall biosynthesis